MLNKKRILIIGLGIFIMCAKASGQSNIKTPNVSGQFYQSDPKQLSADIDKYLSQAKIQPTTRDVEILIAPHAGYVFSGPVAAYSFKEVSEKKYSTIIILAPSHFYGFDGVSIWSKGGFQTPLGVVSVDEIMAQQLIDQNPKFYNDPKAFIQEHAVEVEIPFLQKTFKDFKIVPVVMGQPSPATLEAFAKALIKVIDNRKDVLILVSTDLSHYHDDATARKMDARTLEAIKNLNVEQLWKENAARTMEMCGFIPTIAALLYARLKGLNDVEILRYGNSADSTGDFSRVVGYSAVSIFSNDPKKDGQRAATQTISDLSLAQKKKLIDLARRTIVAYVTNKETLTEKESDPRLGLEEGAFVTIHKHGQLRGCIGNILGRGPLYLTVRDMAIAAASQDPRFDPVGKNELKDIDVEISVLSKPWPINNIDEIQLGVHGVIVQRGSRLGIFLPQVATDTGWSKDRFLSELCSQKAGLPADAWKDPQTRIEIFTADVFSEADVK